MRCRSLSSERSGARQTPKVSHPCQDAKNDGKNMAGDRHGTWTAGFELPTIRLHRRHPWCGPRLQAMKETSQDNVSAMRPGQRARIKRVTNNWSKSPFKKLLSGQNRL
jgi:hypothetical protein